MAELSQDMLKTIRKQFKFCREYWDKQYELMMDDIRFLSTEHQWPEEVKASRMGRPTYASDRLNAQVKQLTNAQRDNRPGCQVHACNSEADRDTAEVFQGIIRHIEYESSADLAYDEAFEWCVRGGLGFWRLLTEYEPNSFDQKIVIDSINNPFMVYIDPTFKKLDGSDIAYAFICEVLTKEAFEDLYPDADMARKSSQVWAGYNSRMPEWFEEGGKSCLVVEYFVKEYKEETIVKLEDERVMKLSEYEFVQENLGDTEAALPEIVLQRKVQTPTITWYKLCGTEILEKTEWLGAYIPIIPVFGDALLEEDGKRIFSGLIRNSKEEQMMLNVVKTTAIEVYAQSPERPTLARLVSWVTARVTGRTSTLRTWPISNMRRSMIKVISWHPRPGMYRNLLFAVPWSSCSPLNWTSSQPITCMTLTWGRSRQTTNLA